MAQARFRTEELIGLGVAGLLHVGLLGVLLMQPGKGEPVFAEQRVSVSLAEDVGLDQVAPELVDDSRAAMAPTLSDQVVPPEAQPDEPTPRTEAATEKPTAQPTRKPKTRDQQKQPKRNPKPKNTPKPKQTESGASRLGSNFLDGAGSSVDTSDTRMPAREIGRQAKASLLNSVTRQLRPYWDAPDGTDAEQLYTRVSWRLNEDGSLAGAPKCKATQGVTPSNRTQASTHCRYAIRAIRRAAPFNLPDRYYNAWKSVKDFKFSGAL